jgi:hypothetical protein
MASHWWNHAWCTDGCSSGHVSLSFVLEVWCVIDSAWYLNDLDCLQRVAFPRKYLCWTQTLFILSTKFSGIEDSKQSRRANRQYFQLFRLLWLLLLFWTFYLFNVIFSIISIIMIIAIILNILSIVIICRFVLIWVLLTTLGWTKAQQSPRRLMIWEISFQPCEQDGLHA